jgi:hypothetical protein
VPISLGKIRNRKRILDRKSRKILIKEINYKKLTKMVTLAFEK